MENTAFDSQTNTRSPPPKKDFKNVLNQCSTGLQLKR